jgi:hypothetical protein
MKHSTAARILISLLGVSFILWGVTAVVLGYAGESATAVITHIRREGGERADGKSNRYTYNISYTFNLPDGKGINGISKKIGSSVYRLPETSLSLRFIIYSKDVIGTV